MWQKITVTMQSVSLFAELNSRAIKLLRPKCKSNVNLLIFWTSAVY